MISVVGKVAGKLMPTAVKSLGIEGALELAGVAGLAAEGLNLAVKGGAKAAKKVKDELANRELIRLKNKQAAVQAEKEVALQEITKEDSNEEKTVEQKNTSRRKNK